MTTIWPHGARRLIAAAVLSATGLSGAAIAQTPPPVAAEPGAVGAPDVTVTAGQALQQKAGDYGFEEIDGLTRQLADEVGRAVKRSHATGAPVRLQLVLQDATPNRPTAAELGRNAGLSPRSIGLGGAWIDGVATMADGRKISIGYSFYETNLRNELGPATWSDAGRAFDMLAARLAKGDLPQRAAPDPAPKSNAFAHFPG